MTDYVALFCPRCGAHVNEDELDSDHDVSTAVRRGSAYTCGWCGTRTTDWNHVLRCRQLGESLAFRRNGRVADLVQLRDELG